MGNLKCLLLGLLLLLPGSSPAQDKQDPNDQKSSGGITGMWRGWYHYPNDDQKPVRIQFTLIQDGATLVGFSKEPNTFGERREPWLHAVLKGTVDKDTGKFTFTKTYDGTAGPSHDVAYSLEPTKDGKKAEGTWAIGDFNGKVLLEKVALTRSGPFSGVWLGSNAYPEDSKLEPVKFKMIAIQHGKLVTGVMKETNTFGNKDEPWLHSTFRGHFDEKTGKLTFTKTYDGTAGVDHDVEYSGEPTKDRKKVEGAWTVPGELNGRFTLEKLRLDEGTVEGLK